MSLSIYDSSGLLLCSLAAGTAANFIGAVNVSQSPYDPSQGPLVLSQGAWAFSYNGLDAGGAVLRNGIYIFVVHSQLAGASKDLSLQVRVLGGGGSGVTLLVAPQPAVVGGPALQIEWQPAATALQLELHSLDGGLVRDFGLVLPPVVWDLRGAGGSSVSAGIYLLSGRVPGQRGGRLLKVAVAR